MNFKVYIKVFIEIVFAGYLLLFTANNQSEWS